MAIDRRSAADSDTDGRAHLRSFQELMRRRVQRILLVSSLYDSFILSEEGQLQETLLGQFIDLNLLNVPDLTRVPDGNAALALFERPGEIDLVITSIRAGGIDAVELTRQLRENGIYVPVIVLAYSNRELADFTAKHDTSQLDGIFLWQGDARILLAMVKYVEDRLNVARDTGERGVPAIIVVEDNVRFYSSFLPVIYSELFRHMQRLLSEELNLSQKMLRMRARPKVLLCGTYEEAWAYFTRYEEQILGVISDIEFPRGGVLDRHAGIELTSRVHAAHPDVRIVLQSSLPENRRLADSVGASFLLKGSPVLLHQLRRILVERFGFGDFIFRLPDGTEVGRAHNLRTLAERVQTVPLESIAYHGERNHFSNWMKARTEFALAERLRARRVEDFASLEAMREHLLGSIRAYQRARNFAVVADFDRDRFEPSRGIMRIAQGSLGGKARGIAFTNRILQRSQVEQAFPGIDVFVPASVVLGTQVFDEFLDHGGLGDFAIASESDDDILRRFFAQPLPARAIDDLRAFLEKVDHPLAVRSSSLLEDSPAQPFAGVYQTYMLPNNHHDPKVRLRQLVAAVKRVYASTFAAPAKSYVRSTAFRLEEEKMAVLIQQLAGIRHGTRFYPDFSGVARSHNFYPQPPQEAADGIVALALGMGRTVVDGAPCLRFCPRYPKMAMGFSTVKQALASSQREFYALDLSRQPDEGEFAALQKLGLDVAEADGVMAWAGSTYLPEDDRVVEGIARPGVRLVTFSQVLNYDAFPLPELLRFLLEHCSRGTAGPVEIEFAGNLGRDGCRPQLAFLQLRPMALSTESEDVEIGEIGEAGGAELVCRSSSVLGNGRIDTIRDVVVVDIHGFDRQRSFEVAQAVARFNDVLQRAGRPYLLVGVGRWGSADPLLGIPVSWNQIAGARVIVEAGFADLPVTPSQGTHFFQNLTSCQVGYFTVHGETGAGFVDWAWLTSVPPVAASGCVRHLRFDAPLVVKMSGRTGEGVILRPRAGAG